MKKKAFTLAEVLITLGIIGIVAAITIPSLITKYHQRETVTKLKDTYSIITNAVRLSEAENGDLSGWDLSNGKSYENFDNLIFPYLKSSSRKLNGGAISYLRPDGKTKESSFTVLAQGGYSYTLLSGVQLFVPSNVNKNWIGVLIDLNGYSRRPNQMGRDAFYLLIYPGLGVQFNQYNDSEYNSGKIVFKTREQLKDGPAQYSNQCNKKGKGMWCGALIQRDGWQISKDYPW